MKPRVRERIQVTALFALAAFFVVTAVAMMDHPGDRPHPTAGILGSLTLAVAFFVLGVVRLRLLLKQRWRQNVL